MENHFQQMIDLVTKHKHVAAQVTNLLCIVGELPLDEFNELVRILRLRQSQGTYSRSFKFMGTDYQTSSLDPDIILEPQSFTPNVQAYTWTISLQPNE